MGLSLSTCRACHASGWIEGHFARLEHTVESTNAATLVATQLLQRGWERGVGQGPAAGDSLFDDTLELLGRHFVVESNQDDLPLTAEELARRLADKSLKAIDFLTERVIPGNCHDRKRTEVHKQIHEQIVQKSFH